MKAVTKVLLAVTLATAGGAAFAQAQTYTYGNTPQRIVVPGFERPTHFTRDQVVAGLHAPAAVSPYLVSGDTFTPTTVVVSRDAVQPATVAVAPRQRAEVRAEARQAVQASRTPSFIGG